MDRNSKHWILEQIINKNLNDIDYNWLYIDEVDLIQNKRKYIKRKKHALLNAWDYTY